jgi:hypothetical protein
LLIAPPLWRGWDPNCGYTVSVTGVNSINGTPFTGALTTSFATVADVYDAQPCFSVESLVADKIAVNADVSAALGDAALIAVLRGGDGNIKDVFVKQAKADIYTSVLSMVVDLEGEDVADCALDAYIWNGFGAMRAAAPKSTLE